MGKRKGCHYRYPLSWSIGTGRRMIVSSPPCKVDECIGKLME
jgi:hypothetical protein